MPITVHGYTSLDHPDIIQQIGRLYQTSPEFESEYQAIDALQQALLRQTKLYTAEFNDKIIAAIWCSEMNSFEMKLHYIVVHPANRGRGVAERLVSEVCRIESKPNIKYIAGCTAIQRILFKLA